MVFYRKYRPQTIAELDNPKLQETLRAVLSQKEIPHAFLFTGPKGLGKTSTARIIAKVLNCVSKKRDGIEPCNECEQCRSITDGTNIDVLEIDGASNRGIDEIRDLKEKINLAPSSAKKKVYIIDEVHMLTTEAFNALLKTIEEPPSHVVFIFATTEPQKVPATIVSRCFHISLKRATDEELIHSLKRIVMLEKVEIDDAALEVIAKMGEGGFRDTQKLFEEIIALSNGAKITKAFVEEKTHITGVKSQAESLLLSLEKKDVKQSLQIVTHLVNEGIDLKYVIFQVLSILHDCLLKKMGLETQTDLPDLHFSSNEISDLIVLFENAYKEIKYAVIQSLPLELAVVMWCQGTQEQVKTSQSPSTGLSLKDVRLREQNLKVKQVLGKDVTKNVEPVVSSHHQEDLPKDVKDASVLLENLIYKVKPYNHSVAGVLRGCKIAVLDDEKIVFETAYKFHKEKLEEQKIREILEKVVREVTGKEVRVMVELKQK